MKNFLKYILCAILVVVLICAVALLWLRYEFQRVQHDKTDIATWNSVTVRSLQDKAELPPPCNQQYPHNKAWFGDLHVHTAASYDATSFGVTATVDDAYRFARGTPMRLHLLGDPEDYEPPVLQIGTPLDFVAVTDHAESLGETRLCYTRGSAAYDSLVCELYRGERRLPLEQKLQSLTRLASFAIFGQDRSTRICGADGSLCREKAISVWQENQLSTEAFHDHSADCAFTTFHAYEYTLADDASNLHRNVIFKSSTVPQAALSAKDAPTPELLWQWLDTSCIAGNERCDVLAIPHNSNWSSGRMWYPYTNRALSLQQQQEQAALRARLEPLAEIMQVKGDSECRNGIASVLGDTDEFCDFEKLRPANEVIEDCGEAFGSGGMMLKGCVSRYSFVRYALTAGLAEQEALGVNPFKFGILASTDTHIGAPAAVIEKGYQGSHGNDRNLRDRLISRIEVPGDIATGSPVRFNPGGIAGIYARENSRSALFDAMQRRETFGTSGPRIEPRFFAGWNLDRDVCQSGEYLAEAYREGVPMGSDLPGAPAGAQRSPVFVASATRDPRVGGNLLQRIQIIKGWIDSAGQTQQAVYDVAGGPAGVATVDPQTCAVSGRGYPQLCASWEDPDFDPQRAAVYYVRVLENPSCRWSRYDCLSLPEAERPASCSDPDLPWQIQERAWTSPIWYQPSSG
ncbi:MAG: DUF3604 domain-containing protein [Halioglobus sp.]|nr:DUF3604 domain-containing protein [Halioglobus sp.]